MTVTRTTATGTDVTTAARWTGPVTTCAPGSAMTRPSDVGAWMSRLAGAPEPGTWNRERIGATNAATAPTVNTATAITVGARIATPPAIRASRSDATIARPPTTPRRPSTAG